ncbi:sodium:alanine symporter family protein, partial [Streptococcus danieliae]|nr:sodium:alanine symporter family protein [Streptococcus danieliae]
MDIVKTLSDWIWSPALLAFLIGAGLYFTIRTKFVQIRMIPEMLRLMFEKPEDSQGISSFQALSVALSGRVGTGNIAGVASAIAFGGP